MTRAHKVLDLLREAMPEYIEWHKVDPYKLMVLERMLKCWDHELGWVVYACPDGCGKISLVPATCKLRFCYFCGYSQQLRWLEKLGAFLPRCPYTMITFTVPLFIRPFFTSEMTTMVDILFHAATEAVQTYAKRHEFYTGTIGVLQLVGSLMNLHPHVHMIVPLGGLHVDGTRWKEYDCYHAVTISGYYTIAFIHQLKRAIRQGMAIPEEYAQLQSEGLLETYLDNQIEYMGKLRKQGIQNRSKHSHFIRKHVTFTETQCRAWNVYVSPSPKNKDSQSIPIMYIGRYMKTPPMTSSRIRSYTRDRVMITVKDYQFGGKTTQTMKIDTFLDSLLMAIPPKSFQIVRRSGLFANTQKEYLDKAKEFLARDFSSEYRNVADPKTIVDAEQISYRKRQKKRTGTDPLVCECGKDKVAVGMLYTGHILTKWILLRETTSVAEYRLAVFWINDS